MSDEGVSFARIHTGGIRIVERQRRALRFGDRMHV